MPEKSDLLAPITDTSENYEHHDGQTRIPWPAFCTTFSVSHVPGGEEVQLQ
jgi:hypothetical protein